MVFAKTTWFEIAIFWPLFWPRMILYNELDENFFILTSGKMFNSSGRVKKLSACMVVHGIFFHKVEKVSRGWKSKLKIITKNLAVDSARVSIKIDFIPFGHKDHPPAWELTHFNKVRSRPFLADRSKKFSK